MMAVRKKAPEAPRKKRSDAKGFKLVGLRLRLDQDAELLRRARERAEELGRAVVDKSEIARAAIDEWLKRHPRKGGSA